MKRQDMLNEGTSRPKIQAANYGFSSKQRAAINKWFPLYIVTVTATVICVLMLLLFGVSEQGEPIASSPFVEQLADKVGGLFARLDFPFSDTRDTAAPAPDTTPSDTSVGGEGNNSNQNTTNTSPEQTEPPSGDVSADVGGIYDFDYSLVPEGYLPIIPMDLSLCSYGETYINNSTGYTPDISALINRNLSQNGGVELLSASIEPLVLIVHTHGTESYSPDGALGVPEGGESVRTTDTEKNVVAVGKRVADILNQNGIPTAHCTIMHDSIQYKDSYSRAEETINKYLAEFPTIKLVIDIHRDSIVKSSGEIVRPVAELDGRAAAQLMCVVGSDWEGENCPQWEDNLSLALKLRQKLNAECENICRPVYLKSHTYNQEIAPYSLLLEVGASGNSLSEALRSAELLAYKLCELVGEI